MAQMTPEEAKAKWKEFRKTGYENLIGADRKLYKQLKKEFKNVENTDSSGDLGGDDENSKDDSSDESGEENSNDNQDAGEKESPRKVETFEVTGDIYCNGTHYEKGSKVSSDDQNFEQLKKDELLKV